MRRNIDVVIDLLRTAFAPNCSRDHQQSFPDTGEALPEYWSTLVRHHLPRCITCQDPNRIDKKTSRNVVKNGSSESAYHLDPTNKTSSPSAEGRIGWVKLVVLA